MPIPSAKKLQKIWAQVPPDYYFHLNVFQRLWHERKWRVFEEVLANLNSPPQTILEVGCAGGHLSHLLSQLFPKSQVTGIDVYKSAITEAKTRYPKLNFKVADAHKLPFPKHTFDLVMCSETIEHLTRPKTALHEIHRVLKPAGHALIEMDSGSLLFRIIWWGWTSFGPGRVWKHAHLHPFSARELDQLIRTNGFATQRRRSSHLGMAVTFLVQPKTKTKL